MGLIFWYMLALFIIIIWTVLVSLIFGKWKEPLEKKNIVAMGPFVMWKTQKGREFIEKVATTRAKWVELYGRISVGITGASMVTMTGLLVLTAYLVIERARDIDIEPHMLLGLPGLNPLIPLWYGIFGLVVAMVVHEFSHGLLTILAKVKVISLGIMFFIFPMGAFVEPDEEAIKKIEKKKRVRMYASGPASNIIVAGIFSLIFSVVLLSSVQVAHTGVGVVSEAKPIIIAGVPIDTPAMNYSCFGEGTIIYSFNGRTIEDKVDFNDAMNDTRPGQNVTIGYYVQGQEHTVNVILCFKGYYYWDWFEEDWGENYTAGYLDFLKWDYSQENASKAYDWFINKGYLGVNTMTVTEKSFHPIGESRTIGDVGQSLATYMTLPLQSLSPVDGAVADFYVIEGFWSFLPDGMFWILANISYWIFWLNLMVGLSNALPAVPLDGGYMFKDWLDSLLGKMSSFTDTAKRTKAVDRIAFVVALAILFLILWQVIGPQIL